MKNSKTIFDLIESEVNLNQKSLTTVSSFYSKTEENFNDEAKESCIGSSINYFKESKIDGEEYFMDESEFEDKSSFTSKNEMENKNINNNSIYKESDFLKLSRLGNGSYGQAFKIKHKDTNKIYAIKEINKSKLMKENKYYQIKIENDLLKLCSHPNIVKYYGFYENQINFSIIEEYCPFGDLSSFIFENKKNLSLSEIQFIIGQIIICLEYLSTKHIVHRDIKPENFLITDNFRLKLIDFGTATFLGKIFDTETNKFIDEDLQNIKKPCDSFLAPHKLNDNLQQIPVNSPYTSFKYKISDFFQILKYPFDETEKNNSINKFEDIKRQKFVGTAEYMSPEIINSKKIGYYSDVWSMVCILYLCFTGYTPFSDKTEYLIFQNITNIKYIEKDINLIPEEALDLIKNFFKVDPKERIGYKGDKDFDYCKIKSHPFFILKDENLNLNQLKKQLMNKCSYYKKFLEKKNKNKENNLNNNNTNNVNLIESNEYDDEDYFNNEVYENNGNGKILKKGLLKKKSPYLYYDMRKVILYDTPRIDYIEPEKNILKGSIILTKNCSSKKIQSNQFELITPERTYIFMCKERYDISPWVSAINNAIEKYGK